MASLRNLAIGILRACGDRNGVTIIRTPVQAPNANAYAERWVGRARRECLDRLLIVSRRQLERVLRVYLHRYNVGRPHRALDLGTPEPSSTPAA